MVATRSSRKRTRSGRPLAEPPAMIVRRGEQLITLLQATQEQGCYMYAVACENVKSRCALRSTDSSARDKHAPAAALGE
eukprot:6215957-Prymnesium_polylepis.1